MKKFLLLFIVSLTFAITGWLYLAAGLKTMPEAFATGAAFPSTKHGGGTTDGETPCAGGVNRGLGTDYSGDCTTAATTNAYHSGNPEAGKYMSGECSHCHEPHAMFGTTEPAPSGTGDAGPDPYLVFKEYGTTANYSYLCWYCHQNIGNINSSGSPATMGRWGFYQGQSVYTESSHYLNSSFYWPGTGGGAGEPWPRRDRSLLPNGNKGSCLNCHTPHGIKAADAANAYDTTSPDGSGGVPATAQTTAANPSVMSDYMIPRQLIAWEETLCERCHDASGPSTKNIQTEINKRYTANQSGHPIDDTTFAGRHVATESLPITTKHVECYDCHNPHAVKAPTGVLGDGDGGRVKGMKFIDMDGIVRDPAVGFRQPYVYEICFRCHGDSYNTTMSYPFPTYTDRSNPNDITKPWPSGTNKRFEFNPLSSSNGTGYGPNQTYNSAYHPVASAGQNQSAALSNQLLAGLTTTSTINCTDCHNNNDLSAVTGPVTQSNLRLTDIVSGYAGASPVGPHGSTNLRILRESYYIGYLSYTFPPFGSGAGVTAAVPLCFRCHDIAAFNSDAAASDAKTNFKWTPGATTYNLHYAHVYGQRPGLGGCMGLAPYDPCMYCHYNIHSNIQAKNTIYGDGTGATGCNGCLPPDGDTHLLNFAPNVAAQGSAKPRWYYNSTLNRMACDLRCHGINMGETTGRFYDYNPS